MTMNPELVYQLVAANPNLKNLVEQTAKLYQYQQQAQQVAPVLQQMAQNPINAANDYVNWQNYQQINQVPTQQQPQQQAATNQQAQSQQGGQSMGMLEQALIIVDEFRKSFATINNNIKEIYDMCTANSEALKELGDKLSKTQNNSKEKNDNGEIKGTE